MKKNVNSCTLTLVTLVLTAFIVTAQAQDFAAAVTLQENKTPVKKHTNTYVAPTMTLATFPGGLEAWNEYLKENLVYPITARENAIEGIVIASFQVDANGKLKDILIEESPGFGCAEEVKRLLEQTPLWQPAMQGLLAVKSKVKIGIRFEIEK